MMKRYLLALCCACTLLSLVPGADAQYMTVSATQTSDSSNNLLSNATISWAPVLVNGKPVSYRKGTSGGGQSTVVPVTALVTNGAFTIQVVDTAITTPANICYAVTVTDNVSGQILLQAGCAQPASSGTQAAVWCTSSACNFDKFDPSIPGQGQVQVGLQGRDGIQGIPGCIVGSSTCTDVISTEINANGLCGTAGTLDGSCITNSVGPHTTVVLARLGSLSTYNIASTVTIAQDNLTVRCEPGVSITTSLTAADALVFTGANQSLIGCSFNESTDGQQTVHFNNATNFTLRDNVFTSTNATAYAARVDGVNGLTVDNNVMPGLFQVYGNSSYARLTNNRFGQVYLQSSSAGSNPISDIIITGNHFVVDPTIQNIQGVPTGLVVQNSVGDGTITKFVASGNTFDVVNTTASTPIFAVFSLVSADTKNCSVTQNVVNAVGQYISYADAEIGFSNCDFSHNIFNTPDSFTQTYQCIANYSGTNTISHNTCNGFGTNALAAIQIYPQGNSPGVANHADFLHIVDNILLNPSTYSNQAGILLNCNVVGSSSLFDVIAGNTIVGPFLNGGIAMFDQHAGGCPISASIEGGQIVTNGVGITSNGTTASSYSIGHIAFGPNVTPLHREQGTFVLAPADYLSPIVAHAGLQLPLLPNAVLTTDADGNVGSGSQSAAYTLGGTITSSNITLGAGAGTGATFTVSGLDGNFQFVLHTGSAPAAGVIFNLSYTAPRGHSSYGGGYPANNTDSTGQLSGTSQPKMGGNSDTAFEWYSGATALAANTQYVWNFINP